MVNFFRFVNLQMSTNLQGLLNSLVHFKNLNLINGTEIINDKNLKQNVRFSN